MSLYRYICRGKSGLIFEKLSQHLGIVFVYEDTPIQAELSQSVSPLTPDAFAVMPWQWLNQLKEAATIAKAAPILALISQIPEQEHVLSVELKRMVKSDRFESSIHVVEAITNYEA